MTVENNASPEQVLDFWFPADGHGAAVDSHHAFWMHRMRGGVDEEIRARFAGLTEAAARGRLDDWAATPRGRLALVIALDQFPRSVWRDTPAAYAQDIAAGRLVLEGLGNGHYDALPNIWERAFCVIGLAHSEGPGHLARMDRAMELSRQLVGAAPGHLNLHYRILEDQNRLAREVIATFGRYPHRNAVLGRPSTDAEQAYLAVGEFPHQRKLPGTEEEIEALLAERRSAIRPAQA